MPAMVVVVRKRLSTFVKKCERYTFVKKCERAPAGRTSVCNLRTHHVLRVGRVPMDRSQ